jgi:hypothetical protein
VDHGHRILHGDDLFAPAGHIAIGAAQRGQYQCRVPMDQMAAVELGRNLHGECTGAQRRLGHRGVWGGGGEVAAHADEHRRAAVTHCSDGVDGVEPVAARAGDAEVRIQRC